MLLNEDVTMIGLAIPRGSYIRATSNITDRLVMFEIGRRFVLRQSWSDIRLHTEEPFGPVNRMPFNDRPDVVFAAVSKTTRSFVVVLSGWMTQWHNLLGLFVSCVFRSSYNFMKSVYCLWILLSFCRCRSNASNLEYAVDFDSPSDAGSSDSGRRTTNRPLWFMIVVCVKYVPQAYSATVRSDILDFPELFNQLSHRYVVFTECCTNRFSPLLYFSE